MTTQPGRFHRSLFCLRPVLAILLGVIVSTSAMAAEESLDWGSGYYRLTPSRDRPFSSSETRRQEDRQRFDRDGYRNSERSRSKQKNWRDDERQVRSRDLPSDFYPDSRNRGRSYDRPWGEIPPEWRNEDLDKWPPTEERLGSRRRYPRYNDVPNGGRWVIPDEEMYDESGMWSYPYIPSRDFRRRDYAPSAPYYFDDRSRDWGPRRRDPYYYYDGGNSWW